MPTLIVAMKVGHANMTAMGGHTENRGVMRWGILGFCLGVGGVSLLPNLPPSWSLVLLLLAGLSLISQGQRLLGGLSLGVVWAAFYGQSLLSQQLPTELEGRDVTLTGQIVSFPAPTIRGQRFEFQIDLWEGRALPAEFPARVRLTWYTPTPPLAAGERWQLTVRLKRPHGLQNPGSFDYETWLFAQQIRATGYVRSAPTPQRLAVPWYAAPLLQFRQQLRVQLLPHLAHAPGGGIILALSLGDASLITPAQWETLRVTGTIHLVSVSGLHITLLAGLAYALIRRLWPLLGSAALYLPAQQAGAWAGLMTALIYALLAGMSVPTQRALVMSAVLFGALLTRRQTHTLDLLLLALTLVLALDPLAVLSSGFWLSFLSVSALMLAFNETQRRHWLRQWLAAQGVANLALLLPLLWLFQQVPLLAPLANLIAIPWVSFIVTPLAVFGALLVPLWPWGGSNMLALALVTLAPQWILLETCASWPFGLLTLPAPPVWSLLLALPGIVLLIAPRGLPGRWLGGLLLLPALVGQPPRPPPEEAWFTLLDVGQGLSSVVRTAHHTLVYDTGARWSEDGAQALRVGVPYLRNQGISRIDRLVLSHADNDHSGGAELLSQALPTGQIITSAPEAFPTLATDTCQRGQQWRWDGVDFRLLHPPPHWPGSDNERSCVLRVSVGDTVLLLTGDIEPYAEQALLATEADQLRATILVAPHHGSRSSSSLAFVAAVQPDYVLYASGYRNRYRFPHADVVARYAATGAQALDSPESGAIEFRLTRTEASLPERYRCLTQRYWHLRPGANAACP